ncbi:MAG: hypothetical protein ACRC8A_17615 [Microcoleaceae cyanobacterium]
MFSKTTTPIANIDSYRIYLDKLGQNFVGGVAFLALLVVASIPLTLFALLSIRTQSEVELANKTDSNVSKTQ